MLSKKISLALVFVLSVAHVIYTQPSQKSDSKIETKERVQKHDSYDNVQESDSDDDLPEEQRVRKALTKRGIQIIPNLRDLEVTPELVSQLCSGWVVAEDQFMHEYREAEKRVSANPEKYAPPKSWCDLIKRWFR